MGWQRDDKCTELSYQESEIEEFLNSNKMMDAQMGAKAQIKVQTKSKHTWYTLSFTYVLEQDNERVFFASDVPYPYSRMLDHVKEIGNKPDYSNFAQLGTLAFTLSSIYTLLMWQTTRVQS